MKRNFINSFEFQTIVNTLLPYLFVLYPAFNPMALSIVPRYVLAVCKLCLVFLLVISSQEAASPKGTHPARVLYTEWNFDKNKRHLAHAGGHVTEVVKGIIVSFGHSPVYSDGEVSDLIALFWLAIFEKFQILTYNNVCIPQNRFSMSLK